MNQLAEYVREAKERKGLKNDRQLAALIGISPGSVCNIIGGLSVPTDEVCRKIAVFTGDPVEKVLILAAESRAPESTKKAWEHILKAAAKAGVFTLSLCLFSMASPAPVQAASIQEISEGSSLHNAREISIMRHKLRDAFRRFVRLFSLSLCPV